MTRTTVAALLFTSLAACYGAAPPRPAHIPLPDLAPDAEVLVHTESKTTMEHVQKQSSTCPQGHAEGDPACVVTHYDVVEPVTRTTSTASYNGAPINYAQFKVITDPKYDTKLSELAHLSHLCTRANVPRYVGMGLAIGGLITIAVSGNKGPAGLAGWGALGAGGVSYGVGYWAYGGKKCNEAAALYHSIDFAAMTSWDTVGGADYAAEMKELADQFNAAHGGHSASLEMRAPRPRTTAARASR
jgi:hypothetical protein